MKAFVIKFLLIILPVYCQAQQIAIMGAMDQEISILLDSMKQKKLVQKGRIDFYTGKLAGKKVVVLKAGVGKVNATYSTAILINEFSPKSLLFTGVAGGLHPEALPGDVVIGEKLVQYDFGKVDSAGFTVWPFRPATTGQEVTDVYIPADPSLVALSKTVSKSINFRRVAGREPKVFSGTIATGDLFVSSADKAAWLYKEFGALATEMEGAAVAHICQANKVPFVVIRSCSDNANNQAHLNFAQFVEAASANSAHLVLDILAAL